MPGRSVNESPTGIIASTVRPFLHAIGNGTGSSQMAVFSGVPDIGPNNKESWPSYCDTDKATNECAHLAFIRDHQQVMRWAPDVKAFLRHYGIK
ncbi:MAG TPA: hypothetical protein VMV01_19580 [Planctomycetota bacterium]|nr:hypothetical protein [Planctomycetota bacterium]